jgi:hypothetical protein
MLSRVLVEKQSILFRLHIYYVKLRNSKGHSISTWHCICSPHSTSHHLLYIPVISRLTDTVSPQHEVREVTAAVRLPQVRRVSIVTLCYTSNIVRMIKSNVMRYDHTVMAAKHKRERTHVTFRRREKNHKLRWILQKDGVRISIGYISLGRRLH